MFFDDSLFESDCEQETKTKSVEASNIEYSARRCELNWFTSDLYTDCPANTHGTDFMVHKYRADSLYYQKHYRQALAQYETVLKVVPKTNNVVCREVTESIARCWLKMGEFQRAIEQVEFLVVPPHENDWTAWKLISECQRSMGHIEGQVLSLQRCTSLQRYQHDYWTHLAAAYGVLGLNFKFNRTSSKENVCEESSFDWGKLVSILDNSVSLFRPYFSWRDLPKFNKHEDITDSEPHGTPTPSEEDKLCLQNSAPITSVCKRFNCHCSCMFNRPNHRESSYMDIIVKVTSGVDHLCVNFEETSSLCLVHSPFVALVSRQITVTDFCSHLEKMVTNCSQLQCDFLRDILRTFFIMAECSCLLWSRQLLLYFVRYSQSFVRDAQKLKLEKIEQLLLGCHGDMRSFLEVYFNKRRVFEESQCKQ